MKDSSNDIKYGLSYDEGGELQTVVLGIYDSVFDAVDAADKWLGGKYLSDIYCYIFDYNTLQENEFKRPVAECYYRIKLTDKGDKGYYYAFRSADDWHEWHSWMWL